VTAGTSFREERRRVNAAGTLFGERTVLKLTYASLVRASDRWRGIGISEFERRQLERLRDQLVHDHRQRNAPAVTAVEPRLTFPAGTGLDRLFQFSDH
jgi:hypothetical protein